jgi:hypothetical protein
MMCHGNQQVAYHVLLYINSHTVYIYGKYCGKKHMDNLGNQQACQQPAQPGPNQKGLPQRGPWQQPWIC